MLVADKDTVPVPHLDPFVTADIKAAELADLLVVKLFVELAVNEKPLRVPS